MSRSDHRAGAGIHLQTSLTSISSSSLQTDETKWSQSHQQTATKGRCIRPRATPETSPHDQYYMFSRGSSVDGSQVLLVTVPARELFLFLEQGFSFSYLDWSSTVEKDDSPFYKNKNKHFRGWMDWRREQGMRTNNLKLQSIKHIVFQNPCSFGMNTRTKVPGAGRRWQK